MLSFPATAFRKRRGRERRRPAAVPLGPLTLVAATYDAGVPYIELTFDRAVDVSGLDGSQVTVNDGVEAGGFFAADGAVTVISPTTVRVELSELSSSSTPSTTLTATADNGIVAADDGAAWAGVSAVGMPFPLGWV